MEVLKLIEFDADCELLLKFIGVNAILLESPKPIII